jgi:integrase
MRVPLKGVNSRRKRLADGTVKTYYWAWKGKGAPLLPGKPGDPEFIAAYHAAIAKKIAPLESGVLSEVLDKFQDSGEFQHTIGERTRYDYIRQIKRIEDAFGDLPLAALEERGARALFLEWRDTLAKTSLRQADYAYSTLSRILKWAVERGLTGTNPCTGGGKLYDGTRVDKIWSDEKIETFRNIASPDMCRALMLAVNTGQRQGDLLRLTWTAYDGKAIRLRQRKTGVPIPVPVSHELKAALDAAPRVSPFILVNSDGKPWTESSFRFAWWKAATRAGIKDLTFHDLRGTAVVWLARAGCNVVEIYAITGHTPGRVQAILTAHYLPRDGEVAANAIAKLNAYREAKKGNKFPSVLPSALKIGGSGTEEAK